MKLALAIGLTIASSMSLAGENKIYNVNGSEYEGYWAKVSDDAPLVVIVHDWDGLTDYEMKRASMLNEMGYNVFAVDMFGKDIRPEEVDHRRALTGDLYKDREKMRALMQGGLDYAYSLAGKKGKTVVMGYCFGGAVTLEAARAGMAVDGFATFHGGLQTPEGQNYQAAKAPILVLHGTADSSVTMDHFAGLAKELEEQKAKHEMITYSGAPHAFTVFGSDRYREDADKKSWQRFSEFLATNTQ